MESSFAPGVYRFGEFELDTASGELRHKGRQLKLQPQPFKLLTLLVRRANTVVTREEIRKELWDEGTHVDFEQAVNFAIKQVRDTLRDDAERPLFVQTLPRRGYRFIAPVETADRGTPAPRPSSDGTTVKLQKALWSNIAEMRLAEARRRRTLRLAGLAGLALILVLVLAFGLGWLEVRF